MKAIIFATLGLWGAEPQTMQPKQTPDKAANVDVLCATTACRKGGYEVVVRYDAQRYQTVPVSRSPYVTPDGRIIIFPGETIAVQFTVDGDTLSAPKFIGQYAMSKSFAMQVEVNGKTIANPLDSTLPVLSQGAEGGGELPPNTLLITYGQPPGEPGMMMALTSNMPRLLKLNAELSLIRKGGYDWQRTSTCPIHLTSFESWPSAQGPMFLSNFRFLPKDAKMVCE